MMVAKLPKLLIKTQNCSLSIQNDGEKSEADFQRAAVPEAVKERLKKTTAKISSRTKLLVKPTQARL